MSVRLVFTSHGDPDSTFQVLVSRVPASLHLSRDLNRTINNVAETSPKARWAEPGRNPSGNVDAALFHWKGSKLGPNLTEAWSTSSKSHLENVSLQDFYFYCLKTNIAERPQATYWNGCGFNPRWVLGILIPKLPSVFNTSSVNRQCSRISRIYRKFGLRRGSPATIWLILDCCP